MHQKDYQYMEGQIDQENQRSITESQLITNLNWSIEDLLQKISKVTNHYGSTKDLENIQTKEIKDKELAFSRHKRKGQRPQLKKKYTQEDKQCQYSFSTETCSKNSDYSSKQNITAFDDFKIDRVGSKTHYYEKGCYKYATPSSLKQIQEHTIEPTQLKKIHSLFSHQSVREVAESRIISQEESEYGKSYGLQNSGRMITESMMSSAMLMPVCHKIKLSDFELGKSVGSGKFGEVYLCKHKQTGCLFALKKIFKSVIQEYKMQNQFALQLKILYYLDHPNIVKLFTHFDDEYHIFLLMQYVEGGELLSKMGSGQQYVSQIVSQMLETVDYMHQKGVVHRDIKPQNIVISFDNTIKLCDFGWAGIVLPHSMKSTFCGTLDYVSPEMKDIGQYNYKVDIWSIGVLTFQLLTKEAPFKDQIAHWKRRGGKRQQQWDWNIIYPPFISSLAQSFMRNILKQNPQERASLRYCRQHFFIRKHQDNQSNFIFPFYEILSR